MSVPAKKVTQNTTPSKPPSLNGSVASSSSPTVDKDPFKALKELEIKTKAINANNVSRVANSHLVSADEKLHPLLSLKTGKPIDRFPETPKGIAKLSLTLVDSMLLALEADRSGKEDEKRERLRIQIGLKPNPA